MKKFLLLSFMCFAFVHVWAQERTVSGKVTSAEDGAPLPGVNVVLQGTSTGAVTDIDGNYSVSIPNDGGTLVFSFIGLKTLEIPVGSRSVIDVQMETDVTQLSEVVVTGYGSVTKEKSNISAVTVNADKIESRPNPSFVQTLSGQVAGLNISTASGQPGANSTVNLRGVTSINGDTEPLFIIDGAPVSQDNFRSLNPNEIASVSVLKDAGATAIYGNRGANGVVVIETKGGKYNSPLQITYMVQRNVSSLQDNDYNPMNSQQQLRLERDYGAGLGATLTDAEIEQATNTDWIEYFFRDAVAVNHNLQFRKGGDNTTSYFSLGFLDQEGILKTSSLKRYNLRSNITGRSENQKFDYAVNLSINYSENDEPGSIGTSGINQNPILAAYQSVTYVSPDDYIDGASLLSPLNFVNTPLFILDKMRMSTRTEDEVRLIGSVAFNYEVLEGLTLSSRSSADFTSEQLLSSQHPLSFNALLFAQSGNQTPGFESQFLYQEFAFNQLANISYRKTLDDHTFGIGLYTEYFKAHYKSFGFTQEGINPKTYFPGDGSSYVGDNSANDYFADVASANILESGLFSYFGQIDYDFASQFGLSATVRRDASSRFAESNRWGTFWSVAGRVNLHNLGLLNNTAFDVLKIRGSYGTNGNQDITGGGYFSGLSLTRALYATTTGYGGASAIVASQIPNTTLEWETVTQANIGIDAELMQSRLRTTVEGYVKTTSNLFQAKPVSAVNGVTLLDANIGELQNRGLDLTIAYDILRDQSPEGLNLTLRFVGNYNKQEILALPGGEEELIGTGRVGGKLFEYYDYRYAGVNPANGNLLFYTADGEVTEDPNIDTDRVWLDKNIYPDVQGGFGLDFDFKGFFASVQFNYTIGADRYDYDLYSFYDPTSIGQFRSSTDLLNAWTPENRVTDIPSLHANNLGVDGTRFLSSADYLRLRFASVGYNIPKNLLEKINFRMARIFISGENLVTFSEWRGFDPEALDNTSRIYPTPKTWSIGLEIGI